MTIQLQQTKASALRADILRMLYHSQSGHPGGSLSVVEILMSLYYHVASIDPQNPRWPQRDRIVLSKGHAAPALYAILADLGFFPKDDLQRLRQLDCHLQGHPDKNKTPGVDASTGSLGQGVAIAGGMAMAAKLGGHSYNVYAVVGDGELQEGLVWEAAMSAAHYRLDNLTVLLDHNGLQIDGTNDQVMSIGNPMDKYASFGFACYRVDGHNIPSIVEAIQSPSGGKPKFIDCITQKGKGVSFMQDQYQWHGKAPNQAELKNALQELGARADGTE